MSNGTFSGAMELNVEFRFGASSNQGLDISYGSDALFSVDNLVTITDTSWHSLRITVDDAGAVNTYLDGASTPFSSQTGLTSPSGAIAFRDVMAGGSGVQLRNFSIAPAGAGSDVAVVANAGDLQSLSLSSVTGALGEVAQHRAKNGASQSRLGFAAEVLSVNRANIEAANSRILDVDVAQESTALARYNILTQAGTSMLAQANQSSQVALRLIG